MSFGLVLFGVFGLLIGIIVLQSITLAEVNSVRGQANVVSQSNDGKALLDHSEAMRNELVSSLQQMEHRMDAEAERRGSAVSYDQYFQNPALHAGRKVLLRQADFDRGTIRLRTAGYFQLAEDIDFNPNSDKDWRPDPQQQPQYNDPAYRLDFFAALTVEASNIVIDLNGYTLKQSAAHALQQRFYANIELADQPFISGQGPAAFGDGSLQAAHNLVIKNGKLGRSSHHGIHGNGGRRVLLKNLDIFDYEVAAVSLNGFKDVVMQHVHALGSFTSIPVVGTYSNARFLQPFVQRALHLATGPADVVESLRQSSQQLQLLMDQVYQDVVLDIHTQSHNIHRDQHPEAYSLFANPGGLVDGNSYGFLFNGIGVAVNGFADTGSREKSSQRIVIEECTVDSVPGQIVEVVALADVATNNTVKGPAGDRLRIVDNAEPTIRPPLVNQQGQYQGTALSDTQLALIRLVSGWTDESVRKQFGTLYYDPDHLLWQWRQGQVSLDQLVADQKKFHYLRNGDTMFHTNKGLLGIRVDNSEDVLIKNVKVSDVVNQAPLGSSSPLPGESADSVAYTGGHDGGHPGQSPQSGYMGCDSRGIGVCDSHSVVIERIELSTVYSKGGLSYGVDVFNQARDVVLKDIRYSQVVSQGFHQQTGPKRASAVALHISSDSKQVVVVEPTVIGEVETDDSVQQAYDRASTSYSEVQRLRLASADIDKQMAYLL